MARMQQTYGANRCLLRMQLERSEPRTLLGVHAKKIDVGEGVAHLKASSEAFEAQDVVKLIAGENEWHR